MPNTHRTARVIAILGVASAAAAAAATIAGSPLPGARASAPSPSQACSTLTWSRVDSLTTADGHRVYAERPAIVSTPDGLVLLGAPTLALDSTGLPVAQPSRDSAAPRNGILASGAVVRDTVARILPLPPGSRGMLDPQAVATGAVVHALWMEPSDSPTPARTAVRRDSSGSRASALWYARLQRGAWSAPESVAALTEAQWNRWQVAEMMMVGDAIHVIIPVDGVPDRAAVYLRREKTTWSMSTFSPGRSRIAYARAWMETDGRIALAFISGGTAGENGWNRVFTARSADGVAWSAPDELSVPWNGPAYDLALARAADTLYLAWIERPLRSSSNADLDDTVRVLRQAIGDRRWQRVPPLSVPHNSSGLLIALAPNGVVHAVLREGTPEAHLIAATWSAGRWHRSRPPLPPAASLPSLAPIGDDSLVLVFGVARRSTFGPSPQSVIAVASKSCARPRSAPEDSPMTPRSHRRH